MMDLVASVKDFLGRELEKQGRAGVIIWYDPNGTLKPIAERVIPDDIRFLSFDGSYLSLRFVLEDADRKFEKRWVIYIPEEPPEESWLRDFELMGKRLEMDLLGFLQQEEKLPVTPLLRELLREHPENARKLAANWEMLIDQRGISENILIESLLAINFGLPSWDLQRAVLSFVSGKVEVESLKRWGLWGIWQKQVNEWIGWQDMPEEKKLEQRLQATILLTELVQKAPDLASRFSSLLPPKSRQTSIAAVARHWREIQSFQEAYRNAARQVEREYELQKNLSIDEDLLDVETFPCIDELWRKEILSAVSPDGSNFGEKAKRILEIAEKRKSLFWAKVDVARYWDAIALAARLFLDCKQATDRVEQLSKSDDFINSYVDNKKGWWQLDLWALKLAARQFDFSAEERPRFLVPAYRAYGAYLGKVNRSFASAIQEEGWVPEQTDFWRKFVQRKSRKRTAIFFADALRFDLATYLRDQLDDGFHVSIGALRSVLPTITEIGMAALLPAEDQDVEVRLGGNGLSVWREGEELSSRQRRVEWLKQYLGKQGKIVSLDKVQQASLDGVRLLVVTVREIDKFGTFAVSLQPEGLLTMVERIASAIGYLKERGFERIVIVADHGFLFVPEGIEITTIPVSEAKVVERRFAIGMGTKAGTVNLKTSDIGLKGDEQFAFPEGLAVFALQGEIGAFLHGGLSLQESIVPVIEVAVQVVEKKVEVRMEVPQVLTSRMVVIIVKAEAPDLFARPRRVMVEIQGKRSESRELGPEQLSEQFSLSWLKFDEELPEEVSIRLLDADTHQVLEEHRVRVELVV